MPSSDWIAFWDTKHSIYVNARHEAAHFRRIAEDIRAYAPERGVMLDYGCGEALSADRVAEPVARLILCEPAPNVRVMLGARFAGNDKIAVRKPEDIPTMLAGSMDVIVMHSVTQYLGSHEFDGLAKMFRRLLKPGGLLVVGDVIPRQVSALSDAQALLRFGRQEGFFGAASVTLAGYSAFAQRTSRAFLAAQATEFAEPQISNRAAKTNRLLIQTALQAVENQPVYAMASADPNMTLERAL